VASEPRWLLIGNSRWHWARPTPDGLNVHHSDPPLADSGAGAGAGESLAGLLAWAAVGPLPAASVLPAERRLSLAAVPLAAAPAWLGIDRALVGWQAWRHCGGPVLVADAGTVLSLTRVDAAGAFGGGRLLAGAALQGRAMAAGTTALPSFPFFSGIVPEPGGAAHPELESWPVATAAAMASGVVLGLADAVAGALLDALAAEPQCQLLLTGGDGPALLDPLVRRLERWGLSGRMEHRPALALEAMAALVPDQDRPRSARI
jgi:type III pantothenate kinase